MNNERFNEALDGLYAYDTGCTDSGIHDPVLKAELREELLKDDGLVRLSRYVREFHLSDEALVLGFTLEDTAGLIRWLADELDFSL